MVDEQRKQDIRNRIDVLHQELLPLQARVANLTERIAHLELDLRELMDGKFLDSKFQR